MRTHKCILICVNKQQWAWKRPNGKTWSLQKPVETSQDDQVIVAIGSDYVFMNSNCVSNWPLSRTERNYCVNRRELPVIVKTLEHLYKHLHLQEFHLCTDHFTQMWLLSFKNLKGQRAHWVQRLQDYNFTFGHRHWRKYTNLDALSGRPCYGE